VEMRSVPVTEGTLEAYPFIAEAFRDDSVQTTIDFDEDGAERNEFRVRCGLSENYGENNRINVDVPCSLSVNSKLPGLLTVRFAKRGGEEKYIELGCSFADQVQLQGFIEALASGKAALPEEA